MILKGKKGNEEETIVKGCFEEWKIERNDFFIGLANIPDPPTSNSFSNMLG